METKWEGTIPGIFEGYAPCRLYTLSDGSVWRQEQDLREHCYREDPKCRLLWSQGFGRWHLDVEGTSGCPVVMKGNGKWRPRLY